MVEKGIRGWIYYKMMNIYAKANNKYVKTVIKIKNCHIVNIAM